MAVGRERAHAKLVGQGEGLLVAGSGLFGFWGVAPRRNVAKEPQGVCLVAPFLVLLGERQGVLGEGVRFLQVASQHLRLPQGETTEGLVVCPFCRNALLHRLCEQRHGVGDTPDQGVRFTQSYSHPGEPGREVRVLTDAHSPFEPGECLVHRPT